MFLGIESLPEFQVEAAATFVIEFGSNAGHVLKEKRNV